MSESGLKAGRGAAPRLAASLAALILGSGCVPSDPAGSALRALGLAEPEPPAMQWDHRPEAPAWTRATLLAVAAEDDALATRVPGDIEGYCPAYAAAGIDDRRAFWVGLLSAIAKYESSANPKAAGGGGRYIGLMQISPRTAANYGCASTDSAALKDGAANLACAVRIVSYHVRRDALVAGGGDRGAARDWMALRDGAKRHAIAGWVAGQDYCKA